MHGNPVSSWSTDFHVNANYVAAIKSAPQNVQYIQRRSTTVPAAICSCGFSVDVPHQWLPHASRLSAAVPDLIWSPRMWLSEHENGILLEWDGPGKQQLSPYKTHRSSKRGNVQLVKRSFKQSSTHMHQPWHKITYWYHLLSFNWPIFCSYHVRGFLDAMHLAKVDYWLLKTIVLLLLHLLPLGDYATRADIRVSRHRPLLGLLWTGCYSWQPNLQYIVKTRCQGNLTKGCIVVLKIHVPL